MKSWNDIVDTLLPPIEARWFPWMMAPSWSLVCSALILWQWPQSYLLWHVCGLITLILPLLFGYIIMREVYTIFQTKSLSHQEAARDVELWKNRFESLREKHLQDKQVWEGEIEQLHQAIQEGKKEAESLRLLIRISHKETQMAEEQIHILTKAQQAFESQKEALHKRQAINESLQTKRVAKQPISLQDLMH